VLEPDFAERSLDVLSPPSDISVAKVRSVKEILDKLDLLKSGPYQNVDTRL
jgi:hypothetical protein